MKYNWLEIPKEISPFEIVSAFENAIDDNKIEQYTNNMLETYDFEYTFPPIKWFPLIIDEDIINKYQFFLSWKEIPNDYIWKKIWAVTDWHHRVISACNAHKKYIDLELDRSTITNENELEEYDKEYLS